MKKVLLVNPFVQINKRNHIHFLRDWSGGELPASIVYPPLDLGYIAAILRRGGVCVKLLDANALHLSSQEVIRIAIQDKPDFIGIPSAWGSIQFDIDLARDLKNRLPASKIVISGSNVTVNPEIALSSGCVDYVILGEPEKPFLDIVNGIFTENIAYRLNGKLIKTKRTLLEDLDWLPFPARDLLPNEKYIAPFTRKNPFSTIYTSRGCAYNRCTFCPSNIWYLHQIRYRCVESVIEEINEIVNKFKIQDIIFRDLSLTSDRQRVVRICNGIIHKGYSITWRCSSRVNEVDRELLSLMKKAGCYQINYGFESGCQQILDLGNKGITLEDSIRAAQLTKQAGIEISGAFMLGMFGDTEATVKKTIDFAMQLDPDFVEFQIAVPFPATKFYQQCNISEWLPANSIKRWHNRAYSFTSLLSEEILQLQLKNAYSKFYFRLKYIYQRLKKITSLRQLVLQLKIASTLFKSS